MTPTELIAIARADYLDDAPDVAVPVEADYRFKTPFLLREALNAQREACYRQDLRHIYDVTTADICTIALVAGTRSYALSPLILRISDARLSSSNWALTHATPGWLDQWNPYWRASTGTPQYFTITGRTLTLDTAPTEADTLNLAVWREPMEDPDEDDDMEWTYEPEKLAHWIAYRAFSRPDEDTQNTENAKMHRALFDAAFGVANSAQARAELLAYPDAITLSPASLRVGILSDCNDWSLC